MQHTGATTVLVIDDGIRAARTRRLGVGSSETSPVRESQPSAVRDGRVFARHQCRATRRPPGSCLPLAGAFVSTPVTAGAWANSDLPSSVSRCRVSGHNTSANGESGQR